VSYEAGPTGYVLYWQLTGMGVHCEATAVGIRPNVGATLRARQEGLSEEVKAIAWKAQHRLYHRYRHLLGKGKSRQKVVTAVGRELLGFIWAIGVHVEAQQRQHAPAAGKPAA